MTGRLDKVPEAASTVDDVDALEERMLEIAIANSLLEGQQVAQQATGASSAATLSEPQDAASIAKRKRALLKKLRQIEEL
eukprot:CAMPEP_0118951954 /NCGR_PEP_ID=MMETSP1169-20130426/53978_1 /TAXON_ID=36882 /ORGANISM="Pyramimonas obovata, Strain CCMP722" /LENGTH=79 /DNA_ID=CAMNT_0006899099 /DNA_START=20 /DNA_END=256 /DNA_ORIENTATION=-